ncbi:hypothetical protein B0H13DRAFT_1870056 [Mycena leptocephala]|nr:hypothetical protein B0H13DRAFT_1870056 [Mycena leptocephala]
MPKPKASRRMDHSRGTTIHFITLRDSGMKQMVDFYLMPNLYSCNSLRRVVDVQSELSPRAGKVALRGNLCSQMMDRYQESALKPGLLWEIDIVTRVIPATTNLRNARNIRKPVGFLVGVKRANGLTKPSNGLASRYAGLGLGATPKSRPKPEKARLRGHKPVLQAENVTLKTRGWSARLRLGVLMARTRGEYRKG